MGVMPDIMFDTSVCPIVCLRRCEVLMKKLKTAVIGVGNMGSFHAGALSEGKIENAELSSLCDIDPIKVKELSLKYPGINVYADYKEMLEKEELDCAVIAVPHYEHCEIALACFENGLHVLCEKPEAVSVTDAEKMNRAARSSGKLFSLMFNQRTDPVYAKAKELVGSGVLGERKRLTWIITNWYRTQAYYNSGSWRATWCGEGGGVLLNQAPHNLDLWQWIFGMPEKIIAKCEIGKYHNIEVEDDARIYASYKDGATAEFITSTGEFPGTNRLEMIGDRAKIVIEEGKLKLWRLECPERSFCMESTKGFAEIPTKYEEFTFPEAEEGHICILNNFTEAIINGTPLVAPGYEGINELSISNAAYLSAWTGREISIPFDTNEFDTYLKKLAESSSPREGAGSGENGAEGRWKVRW